MAFIGFRIEVAKKFNKRDLDKLMRSYNEKSGLARIMDFNINSKIFPEEKSDLIYVGTQDSKKNDGFSNFSIMLKVPRKKEVIRLTKIINVLGNDRVIRERISVFTKKQSMLNDLKELNDLIPSLKLLNDFVPGILNNGYYYAPEIIL